MNGTINNRTNMANNIESNRIITEFDKLQINSEIPDTFFKDGFMYGISSLQYHSSWDWIMPVWIKFRDIDISEESDAIKNNMHKWINCLEKELCSADVPYDIFNSLATAIQWYNNYKRKI